MKNYHWLAICLLLMGSPTDVLSQSSARLNRNVHQSGASQLMWVNSREDVRALAAKDIEHGLVILLLSGGIAPRVFTTDSAFQAKYQVYFHDEGCVSSGQHKVVGYNHVMFEHLHAKCGAAWLKEVRADVVGLTAWKKQQKKSWPRTKTNRE
jgi:hypothetical protein